MSVTADTTKYTADSHYPTADGFVPAVIAAAVVEAAGGASGKHVTADTVLYTADNITWPTADGFIPGNVIPAEVVDATVLAAGAAVMVEAADAADVLDAVRIPAIAYGGGRRRTRLAVEGHGFGILPPLRGEAYGVVGVAGEAVATLPIAGAGVGEVDDELDELIMLLLLAA